LQRNSHRVIKESLPAGGSSVTPKRIAETKYAVKVATVESVGRGNIVGIPSYEVTSALERFLILQYCNN
jgi:hypothetical protein